jgi:peptidoglycan endopeptidase LytE
LKRPHRRLNKKTKKRLVRFSIIGANLLLVASVGAAIVQVPSDAASSNSSKPLQSQLAADTSSETKPLDTLASTDVAVHVSRLVHMPESTAVTNKADTASAQLAVSSADDQVLSKPQIVSTKLKSKKDIKFYTSVNGDTVSSIAAKFNVTPDTIRLSNGINGESIPAGKRLTISPVNGMTYAVQPGDTPDTLAAKYNIPKEQLIAFNDAEVTGNFKQGETIVLPDAIQPAQVRTASYTNTSSNGGGFAGFAFGSGGATYGGNGYDYGWCTWHAANRRIQSGKPLPTNLGNAISWVPLARKAGLGTGSTPQTGAVFSQKGTGALGHVGYVERVNPDGSFMASDMNYPTWGKVTYRTVSAGEIGNYTFIY